MEEHPKTLLVTLIGKDRPGVTSAMFEVFASAGVEVLDIEQIVLRRRLVLGILVTAPRDWKRLRAAVERTAEELGMSVEVERGAGDNRSRKDGQADIGGVAAHFDRQCGFGDRRSDRRLWCEHRPHRAHGQIPRDRFGVERLGSRR